MWRRRWHSITSPTRLPSRHNQRWNRYRVLDTYPSSTFHRGPLRMPLDDTTGWHCHSASHTTWTDMGFTVPCACIFVFTRSQSSIISVFLRGKLHQSTWCAYIISTLSTYMYMNRVHNIVPSHVICAITKHAWLQHAWALFEQTGFCNCCCGTSELTHLCQLNFLPIKTKQVDRKSITKTYFCGH